MLKNNYLKYGIASLIVLVCVILDQISKSIVIANLAEFNSVKVINNFFYLTLCYNTGGAWSIFSNSTWALVVVSLVALMLVVYTLIKSKSKLYVIFASLFIGGLVGNLIDRVIRGKVTDFLDFKIFGYDFPVFNVADICIVISAFLIVILAFIGDKDERDSESK